MAPPKDYPQERRQPIKKTRIQGILDSLLVSAILGVFTFGGYLYSSVVDNSNSVTSMKTDIQRNEDDDREFKKIAFIKLNELDIRIRNVEIKQGK